MNNRLDDVMTRANLEAIMQRAADGDGFWEGFPANRNGKLVIVTNCAELTPDESCELERFCRATLRAKQARARNMRIVK